MTVNLNVFDQENKVGTYVRALSGNAIPAVVKEGVTGVLLAGDFVKFVGASTGVLQVVKATAKTDKILGVVAYNAKDKDYKESQTLEVLSAGVVVTLKAAGVITAGTHVAFDPDAAAGHRVTSVVTDAKIVGYTLSSTSAANDLIKVRLTELAVANQS